MYHVIRTIKGHKYLYEQESYRDSAGQVRTKSRYLGRVDKQTGELKEQSGENLPSVLVNKINLSKYAISQPVLEENYAFLTGILENIGIDTQDFPKIILRHGKAVGFKKSKVSPHYTVYLPKNQTGNREKFKKAYRKALATAGLTYIKKQKPLIFHEIKKEFLPSYKQTQRHLNTYILNTNDYNRQYKAIILKYFGIYHPTYGNPLKPDDLGLTDYTRKNWLDEYGDLMAEILKKGYVAVSQDNMENLKKAHNTEKATVSEYLKQKKETSFVFRLAGWTKKARKAYKRAVARRQAQQEIRNKLNILNKIFCFKF